MSTIKYKHDNIFGNFKVESDNIVGHQLKGGALFNLSGNFDVYTNIGLHQKYLFLTTLSTTVVEQ